MEPKLPFCLYEFCYEALDNTIIPAYPGTLWHSVFGRALRRQSCIDPNQNCDVCMLLHQCDYPYLFRRIAPPNSEMMRGKEVPVPHIFQFEDSVQRTVDLGGTFSIELTVIGDANEKLEAIIRAMLLAGMDGLGKQRSRARLKRVRQINATKEEVEVMVDGRMVADPVPHQPEMPPSPQKTEITFITPYKPSGKSVGHELDIGHFLMAVVRRISLLQYFYTERRLEADFPHLKALTEIIEIRQQSLQWQSQRRYSAAHGKNIDVSGWTGKLEFDSATELWSYLWLGQWLSVGKNAGMGFGRYSLCNFF